MRRTLVAAVLAAAAVVAVGLGSTGRAAVTACAHLSGTFSLVPGSPGAGHVVYALRVRNAGPASCAVRGVPAVRLLGTGGVRLPTHVVRETGVPPARTIHLAAGGSTRATARFSPDVNGTGDHAPGPCQPVAHTARVTASGDTFVVALHPASRVCERGELVFRPFR